jgi:WhiB family redox-sensing transcriptional regulator
VIDLNAPAWMGAALCAQVDTELFFPELGKSSREAKRICNRCEVAPPCLEFALTTKQLFGVWGGRSERERRSLRRIRRSA